MREVQLEIVLIYRQFNYDHVSNGTLTRAKQSEIARPSHANRLLTYIA